MRTVVELIRCVEHEADAMTVLRRRRSIVGSLGTAQDPRWERVLPLMRAVVALVSPHKQCSAGGVEPAEAKSDATVQHTGPLRVP